MRNPFLITICAIALPNLFAGNALALTPTLHSRPVTLAYERVAGAGKANVRVYNFTDTQKGFVLYSGNEIIGYCPEGDFDVNTAPPALVAMLEAMPADADAVDNGQWTPVAPLQNSNGYAMWNQDSPFNDRCPEYEMGKRSPSGCVATAMAQVMYYHQWPAQGQGSHTYSPAVLFGNTLTADFENTKYRWDLMRPYYSGTDDDESRVAVAELMLHCGIAVEMVYYSQSGAADYDVPPALINYFGYDRGLAYRKREHYTSSEWLRIIHDELLDGRPVLAYGKSSMGGHAFVFDGMDADGFIHVNWGWGGMSNGYYNTSVLTPPVQGIGGADGGFNYSQRIITGIRPAEIEKPGDYHVELTLTEAVSPARKKIQQGGDVKMKLAGKVCNHGWRDAEFDYALLLSDSEGKVVKVFEGPADNFLAANAKDYGPDFGTLTFPVIEPGEYTLIPAVRSCGASGEWIPVRDEYIGYPSSIKVTATDEEVTFAEYDYFDLKAVDTVVPEVIWSGVPTLITTGIVNEGDVEYHGEIRAAIFDGKDEVATTSNYIIDLLPGDTTSIRFTDTFNVAEGDYTLALVNDDGKKVCTPIDVTVKAVSRLGNVSSASKVEVSGSTPDKVTVNARLKADAMFQGLLYAFIYDEAGNVQQGCLYPEFITINEADPTEVTLEGEFENGIPGRTYRLMLAVYCQDKYTFLQDDDSTVVFTLGGESSVDQVEEKAVEYKYYDFNGFEVNPANTKLFKKVKIRSNNFII